MPNQVTGTGPQRVCGPCNGYYVTVYACPPGPGLAGHLGFYKVCCARPAGYFDAGGLQLLAGCCDAEDLSPELALRRAERHAREKAMLLPRGACWGDRHPVLANLVAALTGHAEPGTHSSSV